MFSNKQQITYLLLMYGRTMPGGTTGVVRRSFRTSNPRSGFSPLTYYFLMLLPSGGKIQHNDGRTQHSVCSGRYRDCHILRHSDRKHRHTHYTFEREYQRNASSNERTDRKYRNSHGIVRYIWTSSAPYHYLNKR